MKNYTIIKGYIVEPLQEKPYFTSSILELASKNRRIHKVRIRIEGDNVDYGSFMLAGIQCRIDRYNTIVPDISFSKDGSWMYRSSKPLRRIRHIFLWDFSKLKWVDATTTTELLWKKYKVALKNTLPTKYTPQFVFLGVSHKDFDRIMKDFGPCNFAACEFWDWFVFLRQNNFSKDFCQKAIRQSSARELQEQFKFHCEKYLVAKKAIKYYINL